MGVFYAGFAAFKEEHAAGETAEQKLTTATPPPVNFQVTEKDPEARTQLVHAQERITTLEAELQTARQNQADRTITPEGRKTIIALLNEAPKGTVVVKADWTDGEARQLATAITSVLREVGFSILDANTEVLALNSKGIFLCLTDPTHPPPHAQSILDAFRAGGVVIERATAPPDMRKLRNGDIKEPRELYSDEIVIWVTRKP